MKRSVVFAAFAIVGMSSCSTPADGGSPAEAALSVTSADFADGTSMPDWTTADEVDAVGGKGTLSSEYDGTYFGPCPPSPDHHYVFTVYALDAELALEPGFTVGELKDAMKGHILAEGSLTGLRSGPA